MKPISLENYGRFALINVSIGTPLILIFVANLLFIKSDIVSLIFCIFMTVKLIWVFTWMFRKIE